MPRYRWLLFDADNTLFDFDRAEAEALRQTFEQLGIGFGPDHLPAYRRVNREVWRALEQGEISARELRTRRFELLFEALGIEADAAPFSATYLPNLALQGHLMPDALAVVSALRPRPAGDHHQRPGGRPASSARPIGHTRLHRGAGHLGGGRGGQAGPGDLRCGVRCGWAGHDATR